MNNKEMFRLIMGLILRMGCLTCGILAYFVFLDEKAIELAKTPFYKFATANLFLLALAEFVDPYWKTNSSEK